MILWEDLNGEMLELEEAAGEKNEDFARVKALMDERKVLIDGLMVDKEVEAELKGMEAVLAVSHRFNFILVPCISTSYQIPPTSYNVVFIHVVCYRA